MKPGKRNLAERVVRSRRRGSDYPWWWNWLAIAGVTHLVIDAILLFDWLV